MTYTNILTLILLIISRLNQNLTNYCVQKTDNKENDLLENTKNQNKFYSDIIRKYPEQ